MFREGERVGELALPMSHGEAVTALGRIGEAAEIWRRVLTLATGPNSSGKRIHRR